MIKCPAQKKARVMFLYIHKILRSNGLIINRTLYFYSGSNLPSTITIILLPIQPVFTSHYKPVIP